jgi:hypothetical protein
MVCCHKKKREAKKNKESGEVIHGDDVPGRNFLLQFRRDGLAAGCPPPLRSEKNPDHGENNTR